MIKVTKYTEEHKKAWDEFIKNSKNGTFILQRDYMDYHKDRFADFSLLFFENDKLAAVMPASLHDKEIRSHGGLTYGGIISNKNMNQQKMLEIFDVIKIFLSKSRIEKLIYKAVPLVYHSYPAAEDLYALFVNGAKLIRRDASTSIYLPDKINFNERRRRNIKKAQKDNVVVRESADYRTYVNLLSGVLREKHDTRPVHSAEEISMLASRFPDNIKLYASFLGDEMLAGVVVFDTPQTVHAQYIASGEKGRNKGALDAVFDHLINQKYSHKNYFDFGISTENNGLVLNEGLISQKQEFGGRTVTYDFYELDIRQV
jgi:hypothetical protein